MGNNEIITGVLDQMRQTMATLWIGAASNLLTGSDMTKLDVFGIKLLGDLNALSIAQITAKFPMQARNPGTGRNESQRLQS